MLEPDAGPTRTSGSQRGAGQQWLAPTRPDPQFLREYPRVLPAAGLALRPPLPAISGGSRPRQHPNLSGLSDEREEARARLNLHCHLSVTVPIHRDAEEALGCRGSPAAAKGTPDVAGDFESRGGAAVLEQRTATEGTYRTDGLLRNGTSDLRSHRSEAHRHRQQTHDPARRSGQRAEGPLRHAL